MAYIYTPEQSSYSKSSTGTSDATIASGVLKFLGASVISVNMTMGFNGSPASLSVNLVEDTQNSDTFIHPDTPSLYAFSLPKGGVGQPIIHVGGYDLNPNAFQPTNTPFYFCGLITGWQETKRDISGKTISVSLSDPREMFNGIQCLLGGFALSQNVTGSLPRYSDVKNVIDVFGFYDYGMTSGRNEYGITWDKIKYCLENIKATVNNISFEFYFTGDCFTDVPTWYRINDEIIDLNGLLQKVAQDGGSDFVTIARKVSSNTCVVEIRGIKRTNFDLLTQSELDDFVNARTDIVDTYKKGKEYRNEPTASIIVGGMRNSNYTAYPTSYSQNMHLLADNCPGGSGALTENYGSFPEDIKVRLFGGSGIIYAPNCTTSGITETVTNFNVNTGAIFPFWGFTPDDYAYPLVEPFLPLDHFLFDKTTDYYANIKGRTPNCSIVVDNFTVREVVHQDIFLDGDGDSDERPFAYLSGYQISPSGAVPSGYMKGLPLNTEVLRASLSGPDTFFNIYWVYYPDIAASLGFPKIDWSTVSDHVNQCVAANQYPDLENHKFALVGQQSYELTLQQFDFAIASDSSISKAIVNDAMAGQTFISSILDTYSLKLYEAVKNYATENMGKRFLVCLPRSEIMNRIWSGLEVPTNENKPTIEYVVDQRGYWEYVPPELDGIVSGTSGTVFTAAQEDQIRRRFMAEDSRFSAMVGIDWKPSGNINFNSNARNKALFQDLPISEFRPNNISDGNPSYVLTSCNVQQLIKRPDLALLELPAPIRFDPIDNPTNSSYNYRDSGNDENIVKKFGLIKYIQYVLNNDIQLRQAMEKAATWIGVPFNQYCSDIINIWANDIAYSMEYGITNEMSTEMVMDLKGAIIPLTSTWVSYGPWFTASGNAEGMVKIDIDSSLVPWNFDRPNSALSWDTNLNAAGEEKLARTISDMYWLDNAIITAAGFPEYGPVSALGYNSNLTSISVDFGIGGVKTTYNFSTYLKKPGTFRKSEFDNVTNARVDTREKLPEVQNLNIAYDIAPGNFGTNRFEY